MTDFKLQNNNEMILVDDDEGSFLIFKICAQRSSLKNPILTFSSGTDFLKHMEQLAPDPLRMPALVLLDVNMPGKDGFEVLKAIREIAMFKKVPPIIMFSSSESKKDMQKAKDLGANQYQIKPNNIAEFIEFLNSMQMDPQTP